MSMKGLNDRTGSGSDMRPDIALGCGYGKEPGRCSKDTF